MIAPFQNVLSIALLISPFPLLIRFAFPKRLEIGGCVRSWRLRVFAISAVLNCCRNRSESAGGSHRRVLISTVFFRRFFRSSNPASAESQSAGLFEKKSATRIGKAVTLLLFAMLFTANLQCTLPTASDLLVSSLRCSPSAFDSFRANTEVRYTLAKASTITLYIAQRNESGQLVLVNTLAEKIYETKGSHGHTWLGDTHLGVFAESGDYIAVLQIESSHYEAGVRVFHW